MVAEKDGGRVAHQAARRNNMHSRGEWRQFDAYGGDNSICFRQEYHLFRKVSAKRTAGMHKLSMDEVKQVELDILLEFDHICAEHGLTYLLGYGTALGAARHGGFIPWDDDVDVIMPRDDYERLFLLFSEGSLETGLKLTSYRDGSSIYNFMKLTDPRTRVEETFVGDDYSSSGLWIDIFPIERVPLSTDSTRTYRACRRQYLLRELGVGDPNRGTSSAAILVKRVLHPISKRHDPLDRARIIDEKARALNMKPPKDGSRVEWVCIDDLTLSASRYPDEMLFPPRLLDFEGHELPAPGAIDEYLTHCYGDWRQLPPESERIPHFTEAYSSEE